MATRCSEIKVYDHFLLVWTFINLVQVQKTQKDTFTNQQLKKTNQTQNQPSSLAFLPKIIVLSTFGLKMYVKAPC
jgi:hypothetical protein